MCNVKTYEQKLNEWLEKETGNTSVNAFSLCKRFGFPDTEIKVMQLDGYDDSRLQPVIDNDEDLKKLYDEARKSKNMVKRRGNRTWTHYFKDLICGWIMEEAMKRYLMKCGIEVISNGADKKRQILIQNVTIKPDFMVRYGGGTRLLELTVEWSNILTEKNYIEKRDEGAFRTMQSYNAIWLFFDFPNDKYVIIDFAVEEIKGRLRWHQKWGKNVERYILSENNKLVRETIKLEEELKNIVGTSLAGHVQPKLVIMDDPASPPHKENVKVVKNDMTRSNSFVLESKNGNIKNDNATLLVTDQIRKNEEEDLLYYDYGDGDFV